MLSFLFGLIITLAIFIFSNSSPSHYYLELLQQDFKKEIYCLTSVSSLLSYQVTRCYSQINQKSFLFFVSTAKWPSSKSWRLAIWTCSPKPIWWIKHFQSLYSRVNSVHQLEIPYYSQYLSFNQIFPKTITRFSTKTTLYNFYWPCSPQGSRNFRNIKMRQGKKRSI